MTASGAWDSGQVQRILSARGMRVTAQRMVVLRALSHARVPLSYGELSELLDGEALNRVTVYRNLVALTGAGLLVRTQLGDNVWRYELPRASLSEHRDHPHFVCTTCGTVTCMPGCTVVLRGKARSNEINEVQVRGRCVECVGAHVREARQSNKRNQVA